MNIHVQPLIQGWTKQTKNDFKSIQKSWDGVLEGIRTPDPRFRKPVLYPAELPRRCISSIIGRIDCAIAAVAISHLI